MSHNINLIAFGTFGNPNGFRQTFFAGNTSLAKSVKTFDLNTNAIKLFPNSKIYSIRKETVNGYNTIAYTVYTYAKEQNSDRSGTFIGSSIMFTNEIAEENITISLLNNFHDNLVNKNVQDDVITINHSDNFSVNKPKDFEKTTYHLKPVEDLNFVQLSNKNLVVYQKVSPDILQSLLKKAIDLLNVYDTIYFTDSNEVAEYVHQKRIFKLVQNDGFEQEIQLLIEERKRKIESLIAAFKTEKQKLEEDRIKLLEGYKEQIERNESIHQENRKKIDESKAELNVINQTYEGFIKNMGESISQLQQGNNLDEVKQLHSENKRIFNESNDQRKPPIFLSSIPKPIANSISITERQPGYQQEQHRHRKRKSKINIFKIISFVLFPLWLGTVAYFLFFNDKEESEPLIIQPQEIPQPVAAATLLEELTPKPNTELTEKEYRLVAKQIKYQARADEVVKTIFDINPTDIKNNYLNQAALYARHLIELNKNCFQEKDTTSYFTNDTLRHIPAYKNR